MENPDTDELRMKALLEGQTSVLLKVEAPKGIMKALEMPSIYTITIVGTAKTDEEILAIVEGIKGFLHTDSGSPWTQDIILDKRD